MIREAVSDPTKDGKVNYEDWCNILRLSLRFTLEEVSRLMLANR
jgi:hypothetical protein